MDRQKFFDEGVAHVLKQGKPAVRRAIVGSGYVCQYRAPDGSKCLVGGLIPDEQYKPVFDAASEGIRASMVFREINYQGYDDREDDHFVNNLQRTHDQAGINHPHGGPLFISEFIEYARRAAGRHGLSTQVIDDYLKQNGGVL